MTLHKKCYVCEKLGHQDDMILKWNEWGEVYYHTECYHKLILEEEELKRRKYDKNR